MSAKQRLFTATRSYSQLFVTTAVILSLLFAAFFGSDNLNWQIGLAVIALIIGIPHGALDHLVTLPKGKPVKMALFVLIYVLIAVAAVWAILRWNVLGFQLVVIMSAAHFGVGDAAFIAGSGYDLFGTAKVGLRTFWHNRVGLTRPEGAPIPEVESPTFIEALPWLQNFKSQHQPRD